MFIKTSGGVFSIVRPHTFYTYCTLEPIAALREVSEWASFHHERIDGHGYPFHLGGDELPLRSRIMPVADILTALAEDRPYRKAMASSEVMDVMRGKVQDGGLDGQVAAALEAHYGELDDCRAKAQLSAAWEYGAVALARDEAITALPR